MECPGLHSLYGELKVEFDPDKEPSNSLKYNVKKWDHRYRMLFISIGGEGFSGSVQCFVRPGPAAQKSFAQIRDDVGPEEFGEWSALIIGGSRGLGEIAAKLISAGGGKVLLTYDKGKSESEVVTNEIQEGGGQADFQHFNVLGEELSIEPSRTITHCFYYASPRILSNKGPFNQELFQKYLAYFVSPMPKIVSQILCRQNDTFSFFYPSTEYIDSKETGFSEYIAAKSAGESLCLYLKKNFNNLRISSKRLPPLHTDQTQSLIPRKLEDPASLILEELREIGRLSKRS